MFNDQAVDDWTRRVPRAVGAQAAVVGGRHRHQEGRRPRRALARARRGGRRALQRRARAVRAWRRLPRRLDRLERRRSCLRCRSSTAGRRWRSPTRAASSSRDGCPTIREEGAALLALNRRLQEGLGLQRGVSHSEFIRPRRQIRRCRVFLETSARVGGAFIVDTIEAATGINLWASGRRSRSPASSVDYTVPPHRDDYAGIVLSLARQEEPDMSAYTRPRDRDDDPQASPRRADRRARRIRARIDALIADYTPRFYRDFFATAPPPERPVE